MLCLLSDRIVAVLHQLEHVPCVMKALARVYTAVLPRGHGPADLHWSLRDHNCSIRLMGHELPAVQGLVLSAPLRRRFGGDFSGPVVKRRIAGEGEGQNPP